MLLSRDERRPQVEVWALSLRDPVPIVPVPLMAPDRDVPLDLAAAIHKVYDRIAGALRIDYTEPPLPSPLSPDDAAWLQERLKGLGPPQ